MSFQSRIQNTAVSIQVTHNNGNVRVAHTAPHQLANLQGGGFGFFINIGGNIEAHRGVICQMRLTCRKTPQIFFQNCKSLRLFLVLSG